MSLWIILAVIGQLINSVVAMIDKFLVTSKKVPNPILYVFYTGILVVFSILIYSVDFLFGNWIDGLPSLLNVSWPDLRVFSFSIVSAGSMLIGLFFLFKSLVKADASDVFPIVGSISAFFVLFFSYLYSNYILSPTFFFGFIFLVIGTLFISHFRFNRQTFYLTMAASIFLASQAFSIKKLFDYTGFDNGFFWYSTFMVILASCMLLSGSVRKSLFSHRKSTNVKSTDKIVFAGKILAGIAGLLITKAIDLGDVSIVQSLGGLQYLFLFIFAIFFGTKTHKDFGENVTKKDILQKSFALGLILIGFVLLFI